VTTATPAAPAAPTAAQDTAAIQAVLQQYMDGYKALDVAAIRRVFPDLKVDFKDVRSYEVDLTNVQITLQGNRATVNCRRFVRQTGRVGRANEQVTSATFSLRRAPFGWIIEEVR
jgi:hypothetical protein